MYYFFVFNDVDKVDEFGYYFDIDRFFFVVGDWLCIFYNEIYVYDNGDWIKDFFLWQSVQGVFWDDVILELVMKDVLMRDVIGFFDMRDVY